MSSPVFYLGFHAAIFKAHGACIAISITVMKSCIAVVSSDSLGFSQGTFDIRLTHAGAHLFADYGCSALLRVEQIAASIRDALINTYYF